MILQAIKIIIVEDCAKKTMTVFLPQIRITIMIRKIHLWLSLPAGIFITIMCLTGAILVFQQEIQRALDPRFYKVPVPENTTVLPLGTLIGTAEDVLAEEGKELSSITIYSKPGATVAVGASGQRGTALALDPYTGEITGKGAPATEFFSSVRGLHRWLLLKGTGRPIGKIIMGTSSILFSIILISGICIAVPRAWRKLSQWKKSLSVTAKKGAWAWWFTSHRAFGWYCAIFLLLMSLTGPMWTFGWYRNAVASIFGIETSKGGGGGHGNSRTGSGAGTDVHAWERALQEIRTMDPEVVSVALNDGSATVKSKRHHARASDTYKFDAQGNITSVQKYEDLPSSRKFMGIAFLLHSGMWGGWITKTIYLIACLTGAYLVVSGYWLYIRRIMRKK